MCHSSVYPAGRRLDEAHGMLPMPCCCSSVRCSAPPACCCTYLRHYSPVDVLSCAVHGYCIAPLQAPSRRGARHAAPGPEGVPLQLERVAGEGFREGPLSGDPNGDPSRSQFQRWAVSGCPGCKRARKQQASEPTPPSHTASTSAPPHTPRRPSPPHTTATTDPPPAHNHPDISPLHTLTHTCITLCRPCSA